MTNICIFKKYIYQLNEIKRQKEEEREKEKKKRRKYMILNFIENVLSFIFFVMSRHIFISFYFNNNQNKV